MKNYCLITGASKGIGYELAKVFARDGFPLILVARSIDLLEQIKTEIINNYHVDAIVMACDLGEKDAAHTLYQNVLAQNLVVDYLINNAGFGDLGDFASADLNKLNQMVDLNIRTLMNLTYYFLQDMKKRHFGKIMNVASIAGYAAGPYMAVYYASKAFVLSFSEAINKELKKDNISVTVLCPGTTATNFFNYAGATKDILLSSMNMATPKSVAIYGYKKMMKNKVHAIPGFTNQMAIFMTHFVSRNTARNFVYKIQKKRN